MRGRQSSQWRRAAVEMGRIAAILALLGLSLQLLRGDRWTLAAPFTYALVPPTTALLFASAAFCWLLARRKRGAAFFFAAAVATAGWAAAWNFRPGFCPSVSDGQRLVIWNVGHGWSESMVAVVRRLQADVVVLIEGDRVGGDKWPRSLVDYEVCDPGWGVLVFSRRPLVRCERHLLAAAGRAVEAVLTDPTWSVFAVDIDGHPLVSRRRPVVELRRLADRVATPLVLGDLNTPRRAWALEPLREVLDNAWDVAGRGWAGTWPAPLPLLDIDQVWLPPGLEASCATVHRAPGSDHRLLVVDLSRSSQSM